MQLGTRWAFGAEPPRSVPDELRARIAEAEGALPDAAGGSWTLTWLEGRPIAELDDGTVIRGLGSREPAADEEPDEDW
ncbi:hypothetical protein ET445_12075 [Agromyces protaetiae]|uniref:Fe-S oxidoreductase n=1 Tax=Agromyces protaetiae TaxID=2509455 RepID=A0A4P6FWF7_9MICO|nr:hypothetical protein [Agromyces protaetiae]QAY74998.1 hypothetical protein ET445_12075 [Agromyces protaetiae]